MMTRGQSLERFPAHLGQGAKVLPQPEFTGMDWYEGYAARTAVDGAEGRLVSFYTFTEDWTSWEMHPAGDEMVVCTAGSIALLQEMPDGRIESVRLEAGDYAVNPAGTWHTADTTGATALFITAGLGTQHRPR